MKESKNAPVAFEFDFPAGKSSEPLQLSKLNKGLALQAADHGVLERAMLERGVVRLASQIAGAPGDVERARTQFKQPPRESFYKAMAQVLLDTADLYGPRKLDQPRRMHILCNEALEALAVTPESKDRKEIEAKVRDLMKKHPVKA
jgi:hypothetical protein